MSKVEFNKEFVQLRHDVRKARVGIVWKLTKEIKLLKKRTHGDATQVEKATRKAEKLLAQIDALKLLKDDEISKFALNNTKDIAKVLENPRSKPRARVLIRLAFHKALKGKIEQLRDKYPDYKLYLTSKKKQSKPREDSKSSDQPKTDEEAVNPETEDFSGAESDEESIEGSEDELSDADESHHEESLEEKVEEEVIKPLKIQKPGKIEKKVKKKTTHEKLNNSSGPELKKPVPVKVVSKLATVKRLKLDGDELKADEDEEMVVKAPESAEPGDETVVVEREIDSFFVTANGRNNYLQVVVPKRNGPRDEEDAVERNDRNFIGKLDYKNRATANKFGGENKFAREKRPREFCNDRRPRDIKKNEVVKRQNQSEPIKTEMHPSWAAKKKQQDALKQGFQGQKIVFDDD